VDYDNPQCQLSRKTLFFIINIINHQGFWTLLRDISNPLKERNFEDRCLHWWLKLGCVEASADPLLSDLSAKSTTCCANVNPEIQKRTRSFHLPKTTFNITYITHDLVPRLCGFFFNPSMSFFVHWMTFHDLPKSTTSWLRAWGDAGTWHGTSGRCPNFASFFHIDFFLVTSPFPPTWDDHDDQTACFLHCFYMFLLRYLKVSLKSRTFSLFNLQDPQVVADVWGFRAPSS